MPETLTLRQQKFVQVLTDPASPAYCKPTAAYRVISPSIAPDCAHVGASRMLHVAKVEAAINGQLGLEELGDGLKLNLAHSRTLIQARNHLIKLAAMREHRETIMSYAKLTGQLVERQEPATVEAVQAGAIRALVAACLSTRHNGSDGDRRYQLEPMPGATEAHAEALDASEKPGPPCATDASGDETGGAREQTPPLATGPYPPAHAPYAIDGTQGVSVGEHPATDAQSGLPGTGEERISDPHPTAER